MTRIGRVIVLVVALTVCVTVSVQALAASRPQRSSDTIGTLSAKVRALQIEVGSLRDTVQSLELGAPGLSLSPQETYRRLRNLDFKLANVCRYNHVVADVSVSFGQLSTTYADC